MSECAMEDGTVVVWRYGNQLCKAVVSVWVAESYATQCFHVAAVDMIAQRGVIIKHQKAG